jgi:hypothetical protein
MKLQHFVIIIILCLLAWHCSDQDSNILDVNTMKKVMLHKIMAEERFINYLQRDSLVNEDSVLTDLFAGVLAYHKTDSATFYRSLEYYKRNPILFNVLLDSLGNYAQVERDKQYLKMNPPQPEPIIDSTVTDSTAMDSTIKRANGKDSIPKDSSVKK